MESATESTTTRLPKAEQRKLDSHHLRDPLLDELANDLPFFSEDALQLLKFHGSYQQDDRDKREKGKDKTWQMMLRLRSPAGRIPAQLFLAMDDLSNRLGDGSLRATTRQAFQMHGIPKGDLKEVNGTIVENMGSTLAA
ncbi:sulfite reductase, ferredoxin dependent, partial [Pseudomonas sp. HMWF031]